MNKCENLQRVDCRDAKNEPGRPVVMAVERAADKCICVSHGQRCPIIKSPPPEKFPPADNLPAKIRFARRPPGPRIFCGVIL